MLLSFLTKRFKLNTFLASLFVSSFLILAHAEFAFAKTVTDQKITQELKKNPIVKDLNTIVSFLSAGVGLVVVIMIIIGGIQYAMAGDNPQAVSAAKQRILNGLLALLAFLFMFAFLQWLIPGGVFNN